ncbi:MAG: undecaprenyl/decaprenyl-phosphate alpha-N-acetylglucosaminyl 1-phosphate transferase [Gemmatimonadetes bacterium]|nr:undecaprenyl/decaprenyl-phosphate alpha-N-acetylglucosaminyl 1-phosphate transferase [Gemmatimonadota bacterium]
MRSYLFTFLLAVALGSLLTPVAARVGRRFGALDRSRDPAIARAGGLAIVGGTLLALLLLSLGFGPVRALVRYSVQELGVAYLGALGILVLGGIDDVRGLPPRLKFGVEILIAVGLFLGGVRASTVWLPFGIVELGDVLGLTFTVIWIVGITNAFNLLDGIDGAAAGAAVFALLAMFVTSVSLGQPMVALLAVALAGATLGFLPRNFPPARIYLGDAGSLFLGFSLAILAIRGATKGPAIVAIAIPVVAFAVPVLDTLIAVVRRAARGVPLFTGDREHLHHRLLDLGLTNAQAAAILYAVCAAFALASMLFLNPNVRGMAVVLTMVGALVWFAVRHLRVHEFYELARIAQRGLSSTHAIAFNVEVRKAAQALERSRDWDDMVGLVARLFATSEFDAVRLTIQPDVPGAPRREYLLENGAAVERSFAVREDVWGVHIPFQVGRDGRVQGELAVFRRYGRRPLLSDVNLLVEVLRPALVVAAGRVSPPAAIA